MGVAHLVRHGQASFGSNDYDVLSPRGEEQSSLVGAALAARGIKPDLIVAGGLRRHQQTASAAISAAGWDVELRTDEGWDEFDHLHVMDRLGDPVVSDGITDPRKFQARFEQATSRWTSGRHHDYRESFASFTTRVSGALLDLSGRTDQGATAVVFTSGGTIGWVAASLLGSGPEQWHRLNRVTVNTGVTTVVFGQRGANLVSFNEHAHLPAEQVTYR